MAADFYRNRTMSALILAIALILPAHAEDARRSAPPIPAATPWVSGFELLQKLSRPSEAAAAEEYVWGVYDATEHSEWCHIGRDGKLLPKPRSADLQAQVRSTLSALPSDQLKRRAARLLVESWQDKWPCPPNGCCDG